DNVGVAGIDEHVIGADVFVFPEDFLEALAAVGGAEDAALFVGSVGMSGDSRKDLVGVMGINGELGNLLALAKPQGCPGLAGIGGFVDAVANGEVRAMQPFAAAHVDNVRI